MNYKIAVIPGDGIGPEIMNEALKVLDKIGDKYGHSFECTKVLAGVLPSMPQERACPRKPWTCAKHLMP